MRQKRITDLPYVADDDHYQRFKLIVREFVGPLFELFWPEYARLLDLSQVEWLEQEAFPDPPHGKRQSLDLIGKIRLKEKLEVRPGKWTDSLMAILHIEVEAKSSAITLRQRMFRYFGWLRQKYDMPILPTAVYLKVGLDGIGIDSYQEQFGNLHVLQYNYLYVGLPGLSAAKFLQSGGALGAALSALMKLREDERVRHRAFALKQVLESNENDYRKFLLGECVQNYLPLLSESEEEEFEMITRDKQFDELRKKPNTWFGQGLKQGLEQGIEQGIAKGRLELAVQLLQARFGNVSKKVQEELAGLTTDELMAVLQRSQTATKLRDAIRRSPQT